MANRLHGHRSGGRQGRGERARAPFQRVANLPSRDDLLGALAGVSAPMSLEAVAAALGVAAAAGVEALHRRLEAMARDGQVIRTRAGVYGLPDRMDLVRGRVHAHRDGYGFLLPEAGGTDLFLSPRQMRVLMHEDRVVARVSGVDARGRREGAVVEILERGVEQVVGRFWRESASTFVRPDNPRLLHDVLIPDGRTLGAKPGQMVVARIEEPPTKRSHPIGAVVEVLGDHMAPGMETDVAIRSHGIPVEWPEEVQEQAGRMPARVGAAARRGREDLTDLPLVTIDGPDARDYDDAVYCRPTPRGWKLYVAIADVSAYVKPGSAIDGEAARRGNSVYFPDRVVPMLPEVLSNGLCSLVPDEARLCMVCEMSVGHDGAVTRSRLYEAVMRSHARLTYDEVAAAAVDREGAARRRLAALCEPLDDLHALYLALRAAREQRGALDLDSPEVRIVFGGDGKIERVEPRVRNDAHRMIEECMIAANVAAARFLERHRVPAMLRVHDGPTADKLEDLRAFLGELGLRLGGRDRPEPSHYAALIARSRERPESLLVQTALLRSLAQAVYSTAQRGHFGLALPRYAHFTSPIRRYPDLIVHRAIKCALDGGRRRGYPYGAVELAALAEHASMTERRADDATRDVLAWLRAEFMHDKVGEVFDGIVTGVTSFGLFVTLDGVQVDGLLHVSMLGAEYFHFDPVHHRLRGERGGRDYRLADRVRVRVSRVDVDERKIDFELADPPGGARPAGGGPRGAGRRRGRRRG